VLSVIIPTRDRALLLRKALLSVRQQTLPQEASEVIVVDNGSSDSTKAVCLEAQSWFKTFLYSHASSPGLHVARHRGLKLANREILVYADDDMQAEPDWLAAIVEAFEEADVALVGGKCIPDYESRPPEWHRELWMTVPDGTFNVYHSLADLGESAKDIPSTYVFGCNFSVTKNALIRAGGFHPDGMPKALRHLRGDGETAVSEAITNLGFRTRYAPRAAIRHFVSTQRMTLDYIYERAFSMGISDSYSLLRRTRKFGVASASRSAVHMLKKWAPLSWVNKRSPCAIVSYRGYHAGFAWHQRRATGDTALQRWILKNSYLDNDEPLDS
jgi:glycosyltransferase involved in cell wall biosynthesis